MKKILQKIPKNVWILTGIILVGIFLRTYNFHNFLRFNPDQARDAGIVRNVVDGKSSLPLLGPKAGGTEFRLGPFFYYFEITSAKIFGNFPDKMAYPDLIFSILSILILYLFLRKYFSRNVSLLSVALFAVSFYAVHYSRFAWNPNSIPFYAMLFLYTMSEISFNGKKGKTFWWAIVLGIVLGIGIQLHSLLLFIFPIVLVIYFTYLFFKKNPAWKYIFWVIFLALVINIPQIVSETDTGGKNIQAFFKGVHTKSSRSGTYVDKFVLDTVCHIQADSFMIIPIGNDSQCDFIDVTKNIKKNSQKTNGLFKNFILLSNIMVAIVFSLGGYFLLIYFWRRETNVEKKNFLGLTLLYISMFFLILIPLADEISFRFFLVTEFLPFIFLALWMKFLNQYFGKKGWIASILVIIVLVAVNIRFIENNFAYLSGQRLVGNNGFEDIKLSEVEFMSRFIESHSSSTKNVYLKGKAGELFKIVKPINYFTKKRGIKVVRLRKNIQITKNDKLFLLNIANNPKENVQLSQNIINIYNILAFGQFARVRIYQLEVK